MNFEEKDNEAWRVKKIYRLGSEHNCMDEAHKAAESGMSEEQFRLDILDRRYADPGVFERVPMPGNGRGQSGYSFTRLIKSLSEDKKPTGLEAETHQELERKSGMQAVGTFVPASVLNQRDLTAASASGGGYTVATEIGTMIEKLENRPQVVRLGAAQLTGLQGDIQLPKLSASATAYWVGETGAITESAQTFGQLLMSPKRLGATVDLSKTLIAQSSVDIESLVRSDVANQLNLAIDQACINGLGSSSEPLGILNTDGIATVSLGSNGLAPSWDGIVDLQSQVANSNADVGALGYLTNSKFRGKAQRVDKGTDTGRYLWDDKSGADGMGRMAGRPAAVSNAVPSNLVKGNSGAICSACIFGNWSDLIIASWGMLDVTVDPFTLATSGLNRITVQQLVDIGIRHPESFSVIVDALTT